jgi:hypothetical protein
VIDFYSPVSTECLNSTLLKEMLLPAEDQLIFDGSSAESYQAPQNRVNDKLSITSQATCLLETMHLVLKQKERRLDFYSD